MSWSDRYWGEVGRGQDGSYQIPPAEVARVRDATVADMHEIYGDQFYEGMHLAQKAQTRLLEGNLGELQSLLFAVEPSQDRGAVAGFATTFGLPVVPGDHRNIGTLNHLTDVTAQYGTALVARTMPVSLLPSTEQARAADFGYRGHVIRVSTAESPKKI